MNSRLKVPWKKVTRNGRSLSEVSWTVIVTSVNSMSELTTSSMVRCRPWILVLVTAVLCCVLLFVAASVWACACEGSRCG